VRLSHRVCVVVQAVGARTYGAGFLRCGLAKQRLA